MYCGGKSVYLWDQMWLAIVTSSTTGYGDLGTSEPPFSLDPIFSLLLPRLRAPTYRRFLKPPFPVPQTHLGRLAAVLCMVTGPMLVSLMTAALSRTMALTARENRSQLLPPLELGSAVGFWRPSMFP